MAQHCAKRPYVCQHCNFKATYEEVVNTHLPECKYVPLQCPNLCGVTFERDFMEDHMKMCRLEEVGCEFSGVGCDDRFRREDQEEHTRQNSQKHLNLTTSLAVETNEQLELKLQEQDKKHKEAEEKLLLKIEELEMKIEKQEKKLEARDNQYKEGVVQKLTEQKKVLENLFDSRLQCLEQTLLELTKQTEVKITKLFATIYARIEFDMKNVSKEIAKGIVDDWKSPAMYTHEYGYKFCIGVDADGYAGGYGNAMCVEVWAMPGEFDDQLKWPANAKFTIQLINQEEGENATCTTEVVEWCQPINECFRIESFNRIKVGYCNGFIEHSQLDDFLDDDTLHFNISKVEIV